MSHGPNSDAAPIIPRKLISHLLPRGFGRKHTSSQGVCVGQVADKLRKSGTWLDADSAQTDFASKVFVVHPMDELLVERVSRLASRGPFVLFIRSIPGTGKSHLFRTLEKKEPSEIFDKEPFRTAGGRFSFVNIKLAGRDFERLSHARNVILTVPDAAHYAQDLGELHRRIARGIGKVRGVLIAGNTGMLTLDDFLNRLSADLRKSSIAVDYASRGELWLKEYGLSDHANDREQFGEFALAVLKYLSRVSVEGGCTKCAQDTSYSISQFQELIKEPRRRDKIHDLLLAVRLNHPDVYLTPRTLCIFLADTVASIVHKRVPLAKIFETMYYTSSVVSSSYPSQYGLSETNLHSCRMQEVDYVVPGKDSHTERRFEKLRYYLNNEVSRKMIFEGLFSDFIEKRVGVAGRDAEGIVNSAFTLLSTAAVSELENVTFEFRKNISTPRTTERISWAECMFAFPYWKGYLITSPYIGVDLLSEPGRPLIVRPLEWSTKIRPTQLRLKKRWDRKIPVPRLDLDLATFRLLRSLAEGFDLDQSSESPETMRLIFFLHQIRECVLGILLLLGSEREGMIVSESGGRVQEVEA